MPNLQAGRSALIRCLQMLIQYIRSYLPYLEGVSSIRNMRMRLAVVTRDPPNMAVIVRVGNTVVNNLRAKLSLVAR
jgi:hypothetical protein